MSSSQVYLLPGLLTAAECAAAISYFPPLRPAPVVHKDTQTHQMSKVRRSSVSFLTANTDEKQALVKKIKDVIDHANATYFKFDIAGHEQLQLAEYRKDDRYDWHMDLGPGRSSLRKLSASVQLSASDDYGGGDLEMWNTMIDGGREQGTVVIFPSYLPHRVAEVTHGIRKSLVAWAFGTTAFR